PDGTTIAYTCARVDGPEAHDLCLQPSAGGAFRNLTGAAVDRPISQAKWIDDRALAVAVARGFQTSIEIVNAGDNGRSLPIDGLSGNVSAFARLADGSIAFVSETATHAPELWWKRAKAP